MNQRCSCRSRRRVEDRHPQSRWVAHCQTDVRGSEEALMLIDAVLRGERMETEAKVGAGSGGGETLQRGSGETEGGRGRFKSGGAGARR
jgi:hypothetical protein